MEVSGLLVDMFEESDSSKSITGEGISPPGKEVDNRIGSSLHSGHISEPFPYDIAVVIEVVCRRGPTCKAVVAGDEKAAAPRGQYASNK